MGQIEIRPADLDANRGLIVELLRKYLSPRSSVERYRWLYEDNPHGRAAAFLAMDGKTQAIIGSGAVLPRRVAVNGEQRNATVMADFWIHPEHRSLGPAVTLQRACIQQAAAMGFAFFDLPQGKMTAVYRRLGMPPSEWLTRFVKPLKTGPFIHKVAPQWLPSRILAIPGDMLLRLLDKLKPSNSGLRIERYEGDFGAEFDELLARSPPHKGICVARSAGYLQWRYRRHYYLRYSVFVARESADLRAYAVTVDSGQYVELVDLFPVHDVEIATHLLLAVARLVRQQGASALAVSALPGASALRPALDRAGARERERRAFVIHEFSGAGGASSPDDPNPWFLSYGDVDY